MSSQKPSTWTVSLTRNSTSQPWGIRLAGGADLNTPLVITKVYAGTPCNQNLRVGDIIKKIEDYDARDLRHLDAQNLFSDAEKITLVIQRDAPNFAPSPNPLMPDNQPFLQHGVGKRLTPSPACSPVNGIYGYERAAQSPVNNFCRFPPVLVDYSGTTDDEAHDPTIDQQPYRTNPLVLPGAKAKRDQPKAESYLRHHPNPMMRAHPSLHDQPMDTLMKQRAMDHVLQRISNEEAKSRPGRQVVHKQFNTPVGLYSEDNIANSIKAQTGYTPYKKTVQYDPAKSETYKAIQESEHGNHNSREVIIPIQKAYSPVQGSVKKVTVNGNYNHNRLSAPHHPTTGRTSPQPHPTAPHPNHDYVSTDEIHQSGSFKRLMNMVMTEN
ncbi:PDZ and LIM domain protein Zasp isoform X2 [Adelges cooleyi]|uniref:PDZ and LIM domain protein Zasp isoform X2 n=1 Tax=Adelges cooleyi TaxID=133065 RepID=UPI00217FD6DA|nr:PDZ and LIM domain protein Zasp isoform X2 [Adelges cooleyi]